MVSIGIGFEWKSRIVSNTYLEELPATGGLMPMMVAGAHSPLSRRTSTAVPTEYNAAAEHIHNKGCIST
jgi:hypothetical protein